MTYRYRKVTVKEGRVVGRCMTEYTTTDASVLSKWNELKSAGRPWLSGAEPMPIPAR